jgi:hypothetical protein
MEAFMSHTCTHIYDTGGICKSFAVTGQRYCVHHLRHRAHRLRAAQSRARGERFEFNLPPLESLHAVHSALSQLAQAIALGVIDRRSANDLLSVLRVASRNLLHPEKWQESLYQSDQPAPAIDVAAEYGLPADLDLATPPETAFPRPPIDSVPTEALPAVEPLDPASAADPFHQLNFLERKSAFDIELEELRRSKGDKAAWRRVDQHEKEELRRKRIAEGRAAHLRLSHLAFRRNKECLAQKMADEKLAAQSSAPKPPVSATEPPSSSNAKTDQKSALSPTG